METIKERINNKWQLFDQQIGQNIVSLQRMDENCLANLYISLNESDNRCLLHDLDGVSIDFIGFRKNNVSAYKTDKYLVLELIGGHAYFDLFTDLSIALLNSLCDIKSQQESAGFFREMILKWSEFFSNAKSDRLGEKELIGLWGEIYVLNSLIRNSSYSVNEVLNAWKGPFNSNRDFEFEAKHIEVKTIKMDSESIEISSEFQLFREPDIQIELNVLKIDASDNGYSLSELYTEAVGLIQAKGGDADIFLAAVRQKTDLASLKDYDEFRFVKSSHLFYDLEDDEFPRICPDNSAVGVFKVKYKLKLTEIERFIKI
jgi:hypothetical protein